MFPYAVSLFDQVDDYILPSRRSGEVSVRAADTGRRYVMKNVPKKSVVGRVGINGDRVGSMDGVTMNLYGGYED